MIIQIKSLSVPVLLIVIQAVFMKVLLSARINGFLLPKHQQQRQQQQLSISLSYNRLHRLIVSHSIRSTCNQQGYLTHLERQRKSFLTFAGTTKLFTSKNSSRSSVNKSTSQLLAMSAVSNSNNNNAILSNCPTISLRNQMQHPMIGFGTYKVGYIPPSASGSSDINTGRTAIEVITDAIKVGYRFFECAEFYGNENDIGQAIQQSGVNREDIFLCSKVWTTTIEQGRDAIRNQLMKTLSSLQTKYVDLYLIHWPVPGHHVDAYKTLIELRNEGYIRGIGVSNYAWEDYMELKNDTTIRAEDLPLVNQIEINPFLYRSNTISKFEKEGVVLQSYRSLGNGKSMSHPVLVEIAKKYNKSSAQILGRWCIQHGFIYIPKSEKMIRMEENYQVLDFTLSDDDMQTLDSLTTSDAINAFKELYQKCVNRDTSKDGTMEGVKMDITLD